MPFPPYVINLSCKVLQNVTINFNIILPQAFFQPFCFFGSFLCVCYCSFHLDAQRLLHIYSVLDSHLNIGHLMLDSRLSIYFSPRQEAQSRQVLMKISSQLILSRPQFPVSGAAVGGQEAWRGGLMVEGDVFQFGELSGDDLLSDVILPCQTCRKKKKNKKEVILKYDSFIILLLTLFCCSARRTIQLYKTSEKVLYCSSLSIAE